jgi:DNA-binding transcriptional LysR family regulator
MRALRLRCADGCDIHKPVLLIPESHPLAGRPWVSIADLENMPMIVYESNTPHGDLAENAFVSAGVVPKAAVRVRHIETAIGFVAAGAGIAIVDSVALRGLASFPISVSRLRGAPRLGANLSWKRAAETSHMIEVLGSELACSLNDRP